MNNRYGIFLRGINVNGIKIPMKELHAVFEDAGFTDVKTILATGNVLVTTDIEDKTILQKVIESILHQKFDYDAHVIIRTKDELICITEEALSHKADDDQHTYVLLCESDNVVSELYQLFYDKLRGEREQFFAKGNNAVWIVGKNATLESNFGNKVLGSKKYKATMTSRNVNTMQKILLQV